MFTLEAHVTTSAQRGIVRGTSVCLRVVGLRDGVRLFVVACRTYLRILGCAVVLACNVVTTSLLMNQLQIDGFGCSGRYLQCNCAIVYFCLQVVTCVSAAWSSACAYSLDNVFGVLLPRVAQVALLRVRHRVVALAFQVGFEMARQFCVCGPSCAEVRHRRAGLFCRALGSL